VGEELSRTQVDLVLLLRPEFVESQAEKSLGMGPSVLSSCMQHQAHSALTGKQSPAAVFSAADTQQSDASYHA
jgi:hypothetical protein